MVASLLAATVVTAILRGDFVPLSRSKPLLALLTMLRFHGGYRDLIRQRGPRKHVDATCSPGCLAEGGLARVKSKDVQD